MDLQGSLLMNLAVVLESVPDAALGLVQTVKPMVREQKPMLVLSARATLMLRVLSVDTAPVRVRSSSQVTLSSGFPMPYVSTSVQLPRMYINLHNTALVSRHPIYDLMRDYLTLSWARFSKDVQSHTLQISKILAHPAPRAGELIKLDASLSPLTGRSSGTASGSGSADDTSLEVIARFPGGLDFGRGLVDINFTMWPLFKCLNIDNVLTACEVRWCEFRLGLLC
jgi:hypothetical protein